MQQHRFRILIVLISIALAGIVFTQLYWVQKAVSLKEEQFSHAVKIALKSVVNRMFMDFRAHEQAPGCVDLDAYIHDSAQFFQVVSPELLEAYLNEELSCFEISNDYAYAIFHVENQEIIISNKPEAGKMLLSSPHSVALSCIFSNDPYFLAIYLPGQKSLIMKQMISWMLLSIAFLLAVVAGFFVIIFGWLKQKNLSEMKNDFINNMTHELQTPIATISLASEMLLKPDVRDIPGRTEKYSRIIHDENTRLQGLVEQVLQIAVIDQGNYRLRISQIDAHKVLLDLQKSFGITARDRGGQIKACLEAKNSQILADKIHFTNIISNLLDNALKYSQAAPDITLTSADFKQGILISVKDRGMGIGTENLDLVFKKLYRVHTGKVHDVKGFGLGLYYVRRMVEAHHGNVWVESEVGKGSRFFVYFPSNPSPDQQT